jgi:transposase-like protein
MCPRCLKNAARKLRGISRDAFVDYYRCDGCGHVWTTKKGADTLVNNVTDARVLQSH